MPLPEGKGEQCGRRRLLRAPQWETITRVGICLWHVMGANSQDNPPGGGGRKVLRALKNNKIVNEVNILWRLVAVGNG